MATIISSQIVSAVVQRDGRISVDTNHTDNFGAVWWIVKFVPGGTDLNAMLSADASDLLQRLQFGEIKDNVDQIELVGSIAVLANTYSTLPQTATAARNSYQGATQQQAIMIADWMNTLTDTQLMNLFNMTQTQVTNFRNNKLIPAANTAASIRGAQGQ
jgi:hypothetical protein